MLGYNVYSCSQDCLLDMREPQVIMPGTFNPYHAGHQAIAYHADKYTGKHTLLEHSINRVGKDETDKNRIMDLISEAWCVYHRTLLITNAMMFWQKAKLFPGSIFVIGADTFQRIIDHKWVMRQYDGGMPEDSAIQIVKRDLKVIREQGCSFLVYPRHKDGVIKTMPHYDDGIYDLRNFTDMSHRLIQPKFEPVDISSTELRNNI